MLQCLALEQSGVPAIESSYVRTFEWYKDSLWSIKESTEASGPIYTWIFTWLHVADFVSTDVSQLTGMGYVGIAAQPRAVCHAPLTASPNPFSGLVRVSLDPFVPLPFSPLTVRVFDTQGRPVRTIAIRQSPFANRLSLTWDGRDNAGRALPAGAYFIRAADEVCPVIKVR